ncbi:hypothetical protein BDC45DRAFT_563896 [Circinella umbellata]|nr:hypothetical protein BDC45DRAFT_563896 [Circinella umbellata]
MQEPLKPMTLNITDMPETDQQYPPFGFFSTIFLGSGVVARGTDVCSESNANAINSSRQLSSIDPIRILEHRMVGYSNIFKSQSLNPIL